MEQQAKQLSAGAVTSGAAPNHLPVQLTSFVGRETEFGHVRALLFEHRLVTLTGTGGCGKTLGDSHFGQTWQSGAEMNLDEAVAYAAAAAAHAAALAP